VTLARWRTAIIAFYVVLATIYSLITPPFEASDELWHYPMVAYLADNGLALPPQTPGVASAWRQEGSQPPLYYMAAAILTAWIDTSDMDSIRRQNPHADIGVVHPDGNINMMIHPPDALPWRGTLLALVLARFLSIALGAATVWVTFTLARALFPDRPEVILGAAVLNACLPMFLFIAGSVNNDNLSTLIGNLLTLQVVRLLRVERPPRWTTYAVIGVTAGAGLLAKFNIGFMLPIVAVSLAIIAWRTRAWRPLIVGGAISGGLTIVIAGWWYLRNFQLYGDPTGLETFLDIVGRRAIPANLAQIWAERSSFMQAFWGFFGGVNLPLPAWVYAVFDGIALIGMAGGVVYFALKVARAPLSPDTIRRALPYAMTLAWIGINLLSYARWTSETPASQGRLMFGALSSILIWLVVGMTTWAPIRWRGALLTPVVGWFAGVALLAPFAVIAPAYALPEQLIPLDDATPIASFAAPDGGQLSLISAAVITDTASPDDYIFLDLTWRVDDVFARDWSLFVHLVTADDVIIGQRDIYPGAGKLATRDLPPGRAWHEQIAVRVPPNAYAPQSVTVAIGLYHLPTGERSIVNQAPATTFTIGDAQIAPRASTFDVPNPSSINFGGLIELVGYHLDDLSPRAGDSTALTLYWREIAPIDRDYIVFAHIVDPASMTLYAGSDAQPADWSRPTTTWTRGEIIEDKHVLTLDTETPVTPGIYELEIGLYLNPSDGTFPRLRVVTADGGMANDYAYLSRVRVLPRGQDAP